MSKVRVKAGTFNAKQKKKNAPFILRELQRYLIHIFARCFKQVLWMVVGGREGWGTLACRLEEISAGVRGTCCIFLFFLCLWLPHAAKFPSDLPIECLQISAVQEACNPYAMKPRPLQFTCFISFVPLGFSMKLFYLTLYLYTHTRDYSAVFTI